MGADSRSYSSFGFIFHTVVALVFNLVSVWVAEFARWVYLRLTWCVFGLASQEGSERAAGGRKSIHLAGGGYAAAWYTGVMEFLIDNFELDDVEFLGTSAGCSPIIAWLAGMRPTEGINLYFANGISHWNSRHLGVVWDSTEMFRSIWRALLPKDAYKKITGRVAMCTTLVDRAAPKGPTFTPARLSDFQSNEEVIDAICATQNVPGLFGREQTLFRGEEHVDGAVGHIRPRVDDSTITVDMMFGFADVMPDRWFSPREIGFKTTMDEMNKNIIEGYQAAQRAAETGLFERRGWKQLPIYRRGTLATLQRRILTLSIAKGLNDRRRRMSS